jgi:2-polyprenyl-6-methoxyphenol hydroxylase-like FAD-dependent oxidoreductase
MAACCAAIALANIGCRCSLFERTSGQLRSQGAGLVVQPDMADFLLHYKVVPNLEVVAVRSQGRQYLSRSGAILGGNDVPQLFSSWDVLQRALRQAVPEDAYHGGCHVVAVHVEDGRPEIVLADGTKHSCDLLIAADG